MPRPRKYPLRIFVDGRPIQVRSVGNNLFESKSMFYQAHYDLSGQLVGERVGSYQWFGEEKPTTVN